MKNLTVNIFEKQKFFILAKGEALVRGISLKLALEKGDII